MAFLKLDNSIVNSEAILAVDYSRIEELVLTVYHETGEDVCTGFFAIELVWFLKPGAFEGKRLKWKRFAWAFHNIIAHPVMQLLAFFGMYELAMKVHDGTIPKPIGKK